MKLITQLFKIKAVGRQVKENTFSAKRGIQKCKTIRIVSLNSDLV